MLKYKKSQGLPINIIIIAALGLAVLFVLIIIFSNQSGKTISTLESCGGKGGQCREKECLDGEVQVSTAKCDTKMPICCIRVFEGKNK